MLTATALFACAIPAVSAEETAVPDATPTDETSAYIDLSAVPDNIRFLLDTDEPSGGAQTYSADANSTVSALRVVDTDELNSIRVEDSQGNGRPRFSPRLSGMKPTRAKSNLSTPR